MTSQNKNQIISEIISANTFYEIDKLMDKYSEKEIVHLCRTNDECQKKWENLLGHSKEKFNEFFYMPRSGADKLEPPPIESDIALQSQKNVHDINDFDLLYSYYLYLQARNVTRLYPQIIIRCEPVDIYLDYRNKLNLAVNAGSIHAMFELIQIELLSYQMAEKRKMEVNKENILELVAVQTALKAASLHGVPGYLYLAQVYYSLGISLSRGEIIVKGDENVLELTKDLFEQSYSALQIAHNLKGQEASVNNASFGTGFTTLNFLRAGNIATLISMYEELMVHYNYLSKQELDEMANKMRMVHGEDVLVNHKAHSVAV